MPQHTIGNLDFYFHPVQNVLLFSIHPPVNAEQLKSIVEVSPK